jgi:nucleotide-binding universal stress UspA family protein
MWPASSLGAVASSPAGARSEREVPPPFGRIVCGVDGSRSAHCAVEQAIALSGTNTALVFVCVRVERGAGASRQATITAERADAALEQALEAARDAGVDAAAEILTGHDPRPVLLDEASRSDLLVVASHGGSRAGGIALGGTASAAAHRAAVPVLIARRPPEVLFPERILVATDGSPDAERAVELTSRIGHRHRSSVFMVTVEPASHGDPKRVALDAVDLTAGLGVEPTVVRTSGHAAECILETADAERVSLVVIGSRGLSGVRALGSVSERVAHRAHCSVLVARPA